ncbi:MAG: 2-oxo acid dehydrogenase subunit E2 [Deltaproteobacteria bacterium]|jgi:pyruvate dehydrogenase E2 component (dihydrolipoamide acetyltransferase)|nr:2-oxo acid dehydrogenase subunit E2 [Deltaproteobacteria bacterium]
MPNLQLRRKKKLSPFRRMAIGTWQDAYDPSVYGTLRIRMDEAERYIQAFRKATGKRLTISHMLAKSVAAVFEKMPDANAILRWNRIYLRDRIGVFFQVVMEDPKTGEIDLSGCTIFEPEQKTLVEIIDEFERKTSKVRKGEDKDKERSRGMFRFLPSFMLNATLKIISFLSYTLNLNLKWMGIPRDPFGSVMITNIGSIGLSQAYVPLVPYSRVPLLIAVGAVEDVPLVEDGQVTVGREMQLCATFDHRVLDGAHAAVMSKTMRTWLENPFDYFGPIPEEIEAPKALEAEAQS